MRARPPGLIRERRLDPRVLRPLARARVLGRRTPAADRAGGFRFAPGRRPPPGPGRACVWIGRLESITIAAPARSAATSCESRSAVKSGVRMSSPSTTPPCRKATVHPPCRPSASRPPSAATVSGPERQREPARRSAPAARTSTPPRSPAGSRGPRAPRRPGSPPAAAIPRSRAWGTIDAAIAATGITDTAAAAAMGSMRQPFTSMSTSRKSAAVSAAETSASARFGRQPQAGCRRGSRHDRHPPRREDRHQHGGGDRHLHGEDRPPRQGLRQHAADRRARPPIRPRPPRSRRCTPRSCERATAGRSSSAAQTTAAPLTAWTQRAAMTVREVAREARGGRRGGEDDQARRLDPRPHRTGGRRSPRAPRRAPRRG